MAGRTSCSAGGSARVVVRVECVVTGVVLWVVGCGVGRCWVMFSWDSKALPCSIRCGARLVRDPSRLWLLLPTACHLPATLAASSPSRPESQIITHMHAHARRPLPVHPNPPRTSPHPTPSNALTHPPCCRQLDSVIWACAEAGNALVWLQLPHTPRCAVHCAISLARMVALLGRHQQEEIIKSVGLDASLVAACKEALVGDVRGVGGQGGQREPGWVGGWMGGVSAGPLALSEQARVIC